MDKYTVYLADLSYVRLGQEWSIVPFPLNVAYIAAFLQRMRPGAFDFTIVKSPGALLDAISRKAPDIVGFSNYMMMSPCACLGLFGFPRRSGLLYNAAKAFLTQGRFELDAPAEPWAAMAIDDAAECLVIAATMPSAHVAQAVNVGYEGEFSVSSAVAQIASTCGVEWRPPLTTVKPFSMRLQRLESRYGTLAVTFRQRLDEFVDAVRHDLALELRLRR